MARQFRPGQLQTGSLYNISSSYALTASYAQNAGVTIDTGSLVTTSSFNAFTASYTTGSFTGSFKGDGSQLTGIVSSKWTGSNPISRQSDVEITGSLRVQGSITGSLFGTASWAQNAQTASYVLNAVSSSFATSASYAPDTTFPYSGSARITGSLGVTGSVSIKAVGTAATDIPFRIRNSADTRDLFNVRGNRSFELIADTPATNGGISIAASAYNEATINFYDSFASNKMRIDSANALIAIAGSGNIQIGGFTNVGYLGMVTPTTNNRFLKLVDNFANEYLSIGGNAYDGGGGISMTLKTTTTNGTNFVTFSRSNNTNPVVISDLGYLGVGTGSAAARLDVLAQGALSSDTVFRVRNSAATQNLMSITGDGQIVIGLSASINLAANASPQDSVVIGRGAIAGLYATAIGAASQADYYSSVAIGRLSRAGIDSVAVGAGAIAYNSAIYPTLAIGYGANASGIYSGVISIGNPGITNALGSSFAFGINNSGNAQSLFFNRNTNIVLRSNTALTSGTHFDANATNTITIHSGSIPTTTISGSVQMYAATGSLTDNTRPHFRTSNGTIVWLGDESRLFNVTASRTIISSSQNTVSGSSLTVYGSGSALPVFTVQGSQGELFSVTDSLSGSLFSVNDISGLPILEVFSDNTTLIGNYLDPMLITTAKTVQTNSGSFVLYSLPTASYDTAFFEYSVRSGSNARAGTIMAIQSGSAVNFTETTTTDFGNTSAVSFGVFITGSNMALTGSSTSGAWTTKCIIRGI